MKPSTRADIVSRGIYPRCASRTAVKGVSTKVAAIHQPGYGFTVLVDAVSSVNEITNQDSEDMQ